MRTSIDRFVGNSECLDDTAFSSIFELKLIALSNIPVASSASSINAIRRCSVMVVVSHGLRDRITIIARASFVGSLCIKPGHGQIKIKITAYFS